MGDYKPCTWPGHGTDGLGDGLPIELTPAGGLRPEVEHAAVALVRLINANPGVEVGRAADLQS